MIGRVRKSVVSAAGPHMIHAAERGVAVGAVLTFAVTYPPIALAILAAVGDASDFPDVLGMVEEITEPREKQIRNQPVGFVGGVVGGAAVGAVGGRLLSEVAPYASLL